MRQQPPLNQQIHTPQNDNQTNQTVQPSVQTENEWQNIRAVPRQNFRQNVPMDPVPHNPYQESQNGYDYPQDESHKKKFPVFIFFLAAVVIIALIGAVLFLTMSRPDIEPEEPNTKKEVSSAAAKQEKASGTEKTESEDTKQEKASETEKTEPEGQQKTKDPQAENEMQTIASLKKDKPKTEFFEKTYHFDWWSTPIKLSQLAKALEFKENYNIIKNYVAKAKKYKGKDKELDSILKELEYLLKDQRTSFYQAGRYPLYDFEVLAKNGKLNPVRYEQFKKKWILDRDSLEKLKDNTEIPNMVLIYAQVKKDIENERGKAQAEVQKKIDLTRRELWYHKFDFVRIDKSPRQEKTGFFKEILLPDEKLRGVKLFSKNRKYSEEKPIKSNEILQVKVDSEARGSEITAATYRFHDLKPQGDFKITRGKEDIEGIDDDVPVYLGSLITDKGIEIHLQFKEGYSRFPVKVEKLRNSGPYKTWDISGKSFDYILKFRRVWSDKKDDTYSFMKTAKYQDFHWEYVDPETEEIIARWNATAARAKKTEEIVYLYKDISKHENESRKRKKRVYNAEWQKAKRYMLPKKMKSAVIRLVRTKDKWILCEIPPKEEVKK